MPHGVVILFAMLPLAGPTAEGVFARPDPPGRATLVVFSAYVVDVAEIDDARRTFTADLYVVFSWKDTRLANSLAGKRKMPLVSIWHPTLLILNQRSVGRLLPETVEVDVEGNVTYRQRFLGAFSVQLDLHGFPLDRQSLTVRLVNPGLSPGELELDANRTARASELSILDWAIGEPSARAEPLEIPDGGKIAGLVIDLPARRRAWSYLFQFGIPLALIVCMSWGAFWIAPEQLMPRQSISVTSILTVITYRFVLANQLPKVAYLTRFDRVTLGCTALVFLALVEVVAVHWLMTNGRPEQARSLDRRARWVFPVLFVALTTTVLVF